MYMYIYIYIFIYMYYIYTYMRLKSLILHHVHDIIVIQTFLGELC